MLCICSTILGHWEFVLRRCCRYDAFFSISILVIRLLQEACDIHSIEDHPEIHSVISLFIYIYNSLWKGKESFGGTLSVGTPNQLFNV